MALKVITLKFSTNVVDVLSTVAVSETEATIEWATSAPTAVPS